MHVLQVLLKIVSLSILVLSNILYSCSSKGEDSLLETALKTSGDNRFELEAVLEHYADEPEKLEAARWLISNMPGHYSYSDTALLSRYHHAADSFICVNPDISIFALCDSIDSIKTLMGVDFSPKISDCKLVTSNYLIDNIDQAFNQWKNCKWLRHLDFDMFCEYILPYKIKELQPLDDWRVKYKNVYDEELETLDYCDLYNGSAYQACRLLNEAYRRDVHPGPTNEKKVNINDVSVRLKVPHGMCSDFGYLTTVIFRSVGLPIGQDCTPHWGNQRLGHSWNVLFAANGKHIPFTGMMSRIEDGVIIDERLPKVFRSTYASNPQLVKLKHSDCYVPPFFRNIFLKDVTDEYTATSLVTIVCKGMTNKTVYLCVYGDNDWTPVDYTFVKGGLAEFKSVGKNIIYLPVYYTASGQAKAISDPFILDFKGNIRPIKAGEKMTTAQFDRKYPVLKYVWDYAHLVKNGQFEASDDPEFKNEVYSVHTISSGRAVGGDIEVSASIPPCRYWRYINDKPETYCSMAEIAFFDSIYTKPLIGKIIGTNGSWEDNPMWRRENLFDGNALTSYCAPAGTGCWIGLDFGKKVKISKIRYIPRGDGNMVEPGDVYELFYWDGECWLSLGQKQAETVVITFDNIPEGALLLLRDVTKGHDERIFLLDGQGRQEWW